MTLPSVPEEKERHYSVPAMGNMQNRKEVPKQRLSWGRRSTRWTLIADNVKVLTSNCKSSFQLSVANPKPKSNRVHSGQSQRTQTIQWTNQNSKQIHVACRKRGKMCVSESRLVLILLLVGWEIGASLPITKSSNAKQKPKQTRITFDTQVKIAQISKKNGSRDYLSLRCRRT